MCRIFGFRSIINSQVHSSLVHADNALMDQSKKHPDGWGVAYYLENSPHIVKSTECAMDDHIFEKISGVVSSHTVVAHIRKATQGQNNILNSHPFQYGSWVFAHNGNMKDFPSHKTKLLSLIDHDLKPYILGSTDSEIFFFILLTEIKKVHPLSDPNIQLELLFKVVEKSVEKIVRIIGKLINSNNPIPTENYLTFILTSGPVMISLHGGQPLNYCTHKTKCPERESCSSYSKICEQPFQNNSKINHLIFSSEKMKGANVWNEMKAGDIMGVNKDMIVKFAKIEGDFF